MARLTIIAGQQRGTSFVLDERPQVAGRDLSTDILLSDPKASRRHVRFTWADGTHLVTDLDSKNGTTLNGKPLRSHTLANGDLIQIGTLVLRFEDGSEAPLPVAPSAWLRVLIGHNPGATYHLGQRTCTAGRDPGNAVQLVDDDVSRRHVQFRWLEDHHLLVDLGSTNGTRVNGHEISQHRLVHGDRIELGRHMLRFEIVAAPGYADGSLGRKDMQRRHRTDETGVIQPSELESLEIDIEAIDMGSVDIDILVFEDSVVLESSSAPSDCDRAAGALVERVESGSPLRVFWADVLDELARALKPDRAVLFFYRGDSLRAHGVYVRGQPEVHTLPDDLSQAVIRQALRTGAPARLHEYAPRGAMFVGTSMCVPVGTTEIDYGVVYVDRVGQAPPFSDEEFAFVTTAAPLIARGTMLRTEA
ncbi:MAG: FHA domain-containing protein [Myxococcales bacterium]|nr:FHA domain-containing protein [Myxococcales bacterium]